LFPPGGKFVPHGGPGAVTGTFFPARARAQFPACA
jgi:hypothetical protein